MIYLSPHPLPLPWAGKVLESLLEEVPPELDRPSTEGEVEADAFQTQRKSMCKVRDGSLLSEFNSTKLCECKAGMRMGDGLEGAPGHSYAAPRN